MACDCPHAQTGFMSFLRGVTTRDDFAADEKKEAGEGREGAEGEEAEEGRRLAAEQAVLAQWQRMRAALRVG
jgi:hypothetical protein